MPERRWTGAVANYCATMAFIGFGIWFYTKASGYHRNEFGAELALTLGGSPTILRTSDVLTALALGYALILIPYYGLLPGSFVHWARVWNVDLKWLQGQFASQAMMTKPGITVSRWIDGVLEKNENIDQDPNIRSMFFWGHAPNSQTRGIEMQAAMHALDSYL